MSKLISVIIATYNSGKTLERCLSSIVGEKNDSVELIVIDGASVDDTKVILNEFSDAIDYWHSESDTGIYDAWNKGIAQSTGQWLMFIGSDDTIRSGALKALIQAANQSGNAQFISGKNMLVSEDQKELALFGAPYNWDQFKTFMNVAHVASLHHKSMYEDFGQYDTEYQICGDYEFLLRANGSLKTKFIDVVVANMTIGGISYGSRAALREARDAKLKHKVKNPILVVLDFYYSLLKLNVKRMLGAI